jgi:hypothetical protein
VICSGRSESALEIELHFGADGAFLIINDVSDNALQRSVWCSLASRTRITACGVPQGRASRPASAAATLGRNAAAEAVGFLLALAASLKRSPDTSHLFQTAPLPNVPVRISIDIFNQFCGE